MQKGSITARFDPETYLDDTIHGTAAAIPAFKGLDGSARQDLIDARTDELEPRVKELVVAGHVEEPLCLHTAHARRPLT